jgi:hypothetical protein
LLVGLLSAIVLTSVAENPVLSLELQSQVDLNSINFVSNDHLQGVLARTTATPDQIAEAVRINEESRLRALKIGLLVMAGLATLMIIPAGQLPNYVPGEVPVETQPDMTSPDQERSSGGLKAA